MNVAIVVVCFVLIVFIIYRKTRPKKTKYVNRNHSSWGDVDWFDVADSIDFGGGD